MAKKIIFGEELRETCSRTMALISKAVSSSLGPSGKLSLLDRGKISSLITKDGVTIAKYCLPLPSEAMNLIGGKIIEIANKTNAESGDGTTTSIVLANALFEECVKYINKNIDPVIIKRELDRVLPFILKELEKCAKEIESQEDMENVATVSANGDREVGKLIAEALFKVGEYGFVTLSAGDQNTKIEVNEGLQIPKGCSSERYLKGAVYQEFENANILVFDGMISDPALLNDLYQQVPNEPFVVIADLSELAQKFLMENVIAGRMSGVNIIPPMFKNTKVQLLQDIATAVGAKLVSPHTHDLAQVLNKNVLGTAKKVIFNKFHTKIVQGNGIKADIVSRIEAIQEQMEATRSDYEKDLLRERISNLSAIAAIVEVGGKTEDEILEKKDRCEDALNATRSALQEGIIPGGGFALFKIAEKLKGGTIGEKIFKEALQAPVKQIISNTGVDYKDVIPHITSKGYDAREHKFVNLFKKGIVDPLRSTKSGLKNAVSIVDLLINLEVLSVDILDKDSIKDQISALRDVNSNDV